MKTNKNKMNLKGNILSLFNEKLSNYEMQRLKGGEDPPPKPPPPPPPIPRG